MKKYLKKHLHLFSTFCFSLLLISISCVISFSSITTNELSLVSASNMKLYFVSTAKSQLETSAKAISLDQMKNDGSGYVWKKDNYYYIILSSFLNKNDAELVKNKLKEDDVEAEIIEINFPSISITNPLATPESKSTLLSALNLFHSTFSSLFDIAISLETNIYDETNGFLEINKAHAKCDEILKNFQIVFQNTTFKPLTTLLQALEIVNEKIDLLSDNEKIYKEQTLISSIKYRSIEVMQIYQNYLLENNWL